LNGQVANGIEGQQNLDKPRNNNGNNNNRNRRNFDGKRRDRQSGSDKTGVKSVDKREGAGNYNWGSHKQDIDDINKPVTDGEDTSGEKEGEEVVDEPAAPEVGLPMILSNLLINLNCFLGAKGDDIGRMEGTTTSSNAAATIQYTQSR
jgi:hypothetical protein